MKRKTYLIGLLLCLLASSPASQAKESTSALIKKARVLVNEKKNKEAQEVFEKILASDPRHAEAYAGLAWTQFTQGQREIAEANAKKSIELDNKIPMAHNVLGAIYFSKGMVEEAKNEFRTVLKINPKRRCGGCADLRGLIGPDVPPAQNTRATAK